MDCLSHLVQAINTGDIEDNGLPEPIFNETNTREAQIADAGLNKIIKALEKEDIVELF